MYRNHSNITITHDRYLYQGSEMDKEIKGDGNSYTTTFRQLDPRLGRWFSIDPVVQHWQSVYCSMDNNPIMLNDILGNYSEKRAKKISEKGKKRGYDTKVYFNKIYNQWGVSYEKKVNGERFIRSQSKGKFVSIEDGGFKKMVTDDSGFNAFMAKIYKNTTIEYNQKLGTYYQGTFTLNTSVSKVIKQGNGIVSISTDYSNRIISTTTKVPYFGSITVDNEGAFLYGNDYISYGSKPDGVFLLEFHFPYNNSTSNYSFEWDSKYTQKILNKTFEIMKNPITIVPILNPAILFLAF